VDRLQLDTFIEALIGWKTIGVNADGAEVQAHHCPELRAFVIARLGELTPVSAHNVWRQPRRAAALAALLREVADGIDPTGSVFENVGRST
jgi:hypothetical protein